MISSIQSLIFLVSALYVVNQEYPNFFFLVSDLPKQAFTLPFGPPKITKPKVRSAVNASQKESDCYQLEINLLDKTCQQRSLFSGLCHKMAVFRFSNAARLDARFEFYCHLPSKGSAGFVCCCQDGWRDRPQTITRCSKENIWGDSGDFRMMMNNVILTLRRADEHCGYDGGAGESIPLTGTAASDFDVPDTCRKN